LRPKIVIKGELVFAAFNSFCALNARYNLTQFWIQLDRENYREFVPNPNLYFFRFVKELYSQSTLLESQMLKIENAQSAIPTLSVKLWTCKIWWR
jgi:hypothetical protein